MSGGPSASSGPVPWLPRWLARAGAVVYRSEISRRNRAYDRREGVTTLEVPVVSVGNLSVGGTGKTPFVEHLVRLLAAAGHRPCIAMRGYRAKNGISDEAEEYRDALRGILARGDVPVVAQPDRIAGIRVVMKSQSIDCVVLDDGFQHRKLARQMDVVLVDATRPFVLDALLPQGWLREEPVSLARARAVVVTRADRVRDNGAGVISDVQRFAPQAVVGACAFEWVGLDITGPDGTTRRERIEWLQNRRAIACCAIGNPAAFLSQTEEHVGAAPVPAIMLRDHDPYKRSTCERIATMTERCGAEVIVTTRKDWVKMRAHRWPCAIARPVVGVRWIESGESIERHVVEVCLSRRVAAHDTVEARGAGPA